MEEEEQKDKGDEEKWVEDVGELEDEEKRKIRSKKENKSKKVTTKERGRSRSKYIEQARRLMVNKNSKK